MKYLHFSLYRIGQKILYFEVYVSLFKKWEIFLEHHHSWKSQMQFRSDYKSYKSSWILLWPEFYDKLASVHQIMENYENQVYREI